MYVYSMELRCKRCKKEWEYKGKIKHIDDYPQYTSCPRCKSSVKVEVEKK